MRFGTNIYVMSENKNIAIETVKHYMPTAQSWSRALVAGIPMVGGSLDHLIFDKSDEIRLRRLEQSVKDIEECITQFEEGRLKVEWFESLEALEMFKQLLGKIEFEPSDAKVKALSNVYSLFGTTEHSDDPNKYAMMDTISKMTDNQRIIFKAVNETPRETKTFGDGAIEYTTTAIWLSSVLEYVNNHQDIRKQLRGHVLLDVEMDILTSFNLLVNIQAANSKDTAFTISQIGKRAYSYLKEIE